MSNTVSFKVNFNYARNRGSNEGKRSTILSDADSKLVKKLSRVQVDRWRLKFAKDESKLFYQQMVRHELPQIRLGILLCLVFTIATGIEKSKYSWLDSFVFLDAFLACLFALLILCSFKLFSMRTNIKSWCTITSYLILLQVMSTTFAYSESIPTQTLSTLSTEKIINYRNLIFHGLIGQIFQPILVHFFFYCSWPTLLVQSLSQFLFNIGLIISRNSAFDSIVQWPSFITAAILVIAIVYVSELRQMFVCMRTRDSVKERFEHNIGQLNQKHFQVQTEKQVALDNNQQRVKFLEFVFRQLRVPFNSITVGLSYLMGDKQMQESPEAMDTIVMLSEQADTLGSLMHEVMDLHKIDNNEFVMNKREFEFTQLLDRVADIFKDECDHHNITLLPDIQSDLRNCQMLGDNDRIRQAAMYILRHAIENCRQGGKVLLRVIRVNDSWKQEHAAQTPDNASNSNSGSMTGGISAVEQSDYDILPGTVPSPPSRSGSNINMSLNGVSEVGQSDAGGDQGYSSACDYFSVSVSNTGLGMSESERVNLFKPFGKYLKKGSHEEGHDSGLGFYIVKHVLVAHGGDVFVESVLNQGTKFTYYLPIYKDLPPPGIPESADGYIRAGMTEQERINRVRSDSPSFFDRSPKRSGFTGSPKRGPRHQPSPLAHSGPHGRVSVGAYPVASDLSIAHSLSQSQDHRHGSESFDLPDHRNENNSSNDPLLPPLKDNNQMTRTMSLQMDSHHAFIHKTSTPSPTRTRKRYDGGLPKRSSTMDTYSNNGKDTTSDLSDGSSGGTARVLIVEDSMSNAKLLGKFLSVLKIEHKVAENGQICCDMIAGGEEFSLVLMDLNMPVMGGMDATKELRMMGCKTPIVALTGNDCSEDKSEFFRAGGDDFLAKPLEQAKLRLIMQKYLKSYNYGDNDPLSSSLKPIMSRRRGAGRMRTAAGNNRFNRFGSQQRKSESSSTTPTTITIKKSINEDPGNINNNNNNIINNNSIDNRRNSSNNLNNISPKLSSLNPTSNNDTNVNTPKNRRLLPATGHPMLDDMPSPTDNNSE
eukprot:TRINITY_DN1280_c0_g1_i1.p1 TRINITY_DN1280_c0_g1~~TRINITY_DN1280_c0_g1_i1.p1  ORF type:complete len:1043 (+),score=217.86 TRINITY_DN1280_c0_g1_i1:265-3393(+)